MAEPFPFDAEATPSAETPTRGPEPLALGDILLDRYTIVEVLASDNGVNLYRAAEIRRCPNCGVDNEGTLTRCGFCGGELPEPHTLVVSERATSAGGDAPARGLQLDGLTYAFARDLDGLAATARGGAEIGHGHASDPGLVRGARGEPNEDSVLTFQLATQHSAATQTLGLFMVADGVGGAEAGEVASRMAVRTIGYELLSKMLAPHDAAARETVREAIRASFAQANAQVLDYGTLHDVSLGSTLTLALLLDNRAYFANVGDSRTYLFRDNDLVQITHDHSYVAQLVARGEITAQEVRTHPRRNLILRSLGDPSGFEVDIFPKESGGMELRQGDQILLCSDGLWEMVPDDEIANVLRDSSEPQRACEELVSRANMAGGTDNISAVLVRVNSVPV